ncbi:Modulator of FtsH protease HflC [Hartmannibacter diazotrophicus]|uniref:Protein HflC n=1 Tax=Hartmannibacter diazotrophicus TaxID=1482074 RepID=A0A2C9D7W1_9HYPH|nr:protease modulator HflC [Hartmannibacter diazotrophicus]SON56414.1 Modulator of FtsH protease HflC [Hartmannibacter diazotrophicus]
MRQAFFPGVVIALVVAAVIAYSSTFIVNQREQAIQLRFGEIQRVIQAPGIYFKLPTNLVDSVQYYDRRLLTLELDGMEVLFRNDRRYIVDAFAAFRILDPQIFREAVGGNLTLAAERLRTRLDSRLREVYGQRSYEEAFTSERAGMMEQIRDLIRPDAASLGIGVVDLRIRQTELPEDVRAQTYDRMRAERLAVAAEERAQGTQESLRIKAEADRRATVLVAEAQRDAEIERGKGDAEKSRIFANVYGKDEKFFEFYRSMQAYAKALEDGSSELVLSPTSEFFRFFGSSEGAPSTTEPAAGGATAPAVSPAQ